MKCRLWAMIACFIALGVLAASPQPAGPIVKDQSRIGDEESADGEAEQAMPPEDGEGEPDETVPPDTPRIDDIPAIETVELTADAAKRALDAFAEVRDKYNDHGIEQYQSLEEFVDRTDAGKNLEADIRVHGFDDVTQWNSTIVAVSFAYNAVEDDQEADIRQQIEELRADMTLDEATRTRIILSLNALLPSENNKQVLRELLDDPIYREKLRLLDEQE